MSVMKKIRIVLCVLLALICLYTGISCAATLIKSFSQPYLVSGTTRYDFTGYYMMSAAEGAVCVASAAALTLVIKRRRREKKDSNKK